MKTSYRPLLQIAVAGLMVTFANSLSAANADPITPKQKFAALAKRDPALFNEVSETAPAKGYTSLHQRYFSFSVAERMVTILEYWVDFKTGNYKQYMGTVPVTFDDPLSGDSLPEAQTFVTGDWMSTSGSFKLRKQTMQWEPAIIVQMGDWYLEPLDRVQVALVPSIKQHFKIAALRSSAARAKGDDQLAAQVEAETLKYGIEHGPVVEQFMVGPDGARRENRYEITDSLIASSRLVKDGTVITRCENDFGGDISLEPKGWLLERSQRLVRPVMHKGIQHPQATAEDRKSFGMLFAVVQDSWAVAMTEAGSPAALAGLQSGDSITSIDGTTVASL